MFVFKSTHTFDDGERVDRYDDEREIFCAHVTYKDGEIVRVSLLAGDWADSEVADGRYGDFKTNGKYVPIYQWRCWKDAYYLFKSLGLKGR